jgi:hypothetical protein
MQMVIRQVKEAYLGFGKKSVLVYCTLIGRRQKSTAMAVDE